MPRHPGLSPTTGTLRSTLYDVLSRGARRREGPLHRLNVGDTWLEPPPAARAEAQRTADHPLMHTYAAPHGEPALLDSVRERLAGRSPFPVERGCIQITAGATSGISVACQTILDPGDEVLLPSPFWPLIRGIIASRGAVPVQIAFFTRLDEPGFDPEAALEAAVTPRTAAIYLNTPHNPTGRILTEAQVEAFARVARRHDLWLLADEAYEDLWYGEDAPAPAWAREDLRERAVAFHTFSKSYGMAGARVGYAHGPAALMERVRGVTTHQVYCAPRPMQFAALAALREGAGWPAEARRLYAEAGRRAARALGLPEPQAGIFLFFDASPWSGGERDALPFLERCLDAGVLLSPGISSGEHYASWARICFTVVPPAELDDALARLRAVMGRG